MIITYKKHKKIKSNQNFYYKYLEQTQLEL